MMKASRSLSQSWGTPGRLPGGNNTSTGCWREVGQGGQEGSTPFIWCFYFLSELQWTAGCDRLKACCKQSVWNFSMREMILQCVIPESTGSPCLCLQSLIKEPHGAISLGSHQQEVPGEPRTCSHPGAPLPRPAALAVRKPRALSAASMGQLTKHHIPCADPEAVVFRFPDSPWADACHHLRTCLKDHVFS